MKIVSRGWVMPPVPPTVDVLANVVKFMAYLFNAIYLLYTLALILAAGIARSSDNPSYMAKGCGLCRL